MSAAAAAGGRIKVENPVVDLDGDEMTRWGAQGPAGASMRRAAGGGPHRPGSAAPRTRWRLVGRRV